MTAQTTDAPRARPPGGRRAIARIYGQGIELVAWASAGIYCARACYEPIAEHSVYSSEATASSTVSGATA